MAEDDEATPRIFRSHREVFEKLVLAHRGRIFNTAGDAILAEFGSAVEAVRCATEIQAALKTRNDQLTPSRQVRFRIGVNLGDVMVQGTDLLGDGVNVAARLQTAAQPGGVRISGSAYDQIRNKLSLNFKSLGECSYKNIPQPVRTFSIGDAEGLDALPTRDEARPRGGAGAMRWVAAAAVALALAGGYWAYGEYQAGKEQQSRVLAEATAAREEAARREARLVAEKQAAEQGQRRPEAERRANILPQPAAPQAIASFDGIYSGQICLGPAPNDPARCFVGQASISRAVILGQWPDRDPGVTVKISGAVSITGEVKMQLRSDSAEGALLAIVDLAGTIKDGKIAAAGSYPGRRAATLAWSRHGAASAATPGPRASLAARTSPDGEYAGPICYGPSRNDPPRCFRGQATLAQGRFSDQWPGRDPGSVSKISGEVSASGETKIEMIVEGPDGTPRATIRFTGSLRDGRLDANGAFLQGRTATLNWSRN